MHITQLIFRAAQQRANETSTDYMGQFKTWSETEDSVRRLAGALLGLGVQRNERVAVLSLNSTQYYESIFAIPQTGALIVPLNIRWSADELVYAMNDSESTTLIFDKTFLPLVEAMRTKGVDASRFLFAGDDADRPEWAQNLTALIEAAEPLQEMIQSDNELTGIFYTGGTTGFPKGVMLSHNALFTSSMSLVCCLPNDEEASILHAAPMFHLADLAMCITFTIKGSRQVIVPAFEPKLVQKTIAERSVTDALLVPVMAQMLYDDADFNKDAFKGLQRILYGASAMPEGVLKRIMSETPHVGLLQAYGQTEMAPMVSVLTPKDHLATGEHAKRLRSGGRAAACVQIKIVDENGKKLPIGEVGEVCATGPNNMLGYWNKPDQTADTIKDGWIHTGDAGYLDEDGYLFLVDRVKDMIITGGENVYSAEVESALSTHPAVGQIAVIGIPDDEWGEVVHAIVVAKPGAEKDEASIIAHCKEKIAGYKCPKSVTFRDEPLPISGAGKVLKTELRKPFWENRERQIN